MKTLKQRIMAGFIAIIVTVVCGAFAPAPAAPVPGGTLDPVTVPKYVTPLVIPPVMPNTSITSYSPAADYDIAVRQFQQQILPGGIWNTATGTTGLNYPATTVWSYGSAGDPMPDSSGLGGALGVAPAPNSSFNYPAFTMENISGTMNKVRWINELVEDPIACFHGTPGGTSCNYLRHLFPVDQTLHWANPGFADCIGGNPNRTDCETHNQLPYLGPVPIITHVHGAHVNPESDGYPEAWYLPNADDIPGTYATQGTRYGEYAGFGPNSVAGSAFFAYENTQEAATLWYHDHSMGMTRLNVYAGPAGFWLIRGGAHGDSAVDTFGNVSGTPNGLLPRPAPVAGDPTIGLNVEGNASRNGIREIPIVMQDRSFDWVNAAGQPVPQGDPTAVGTKLWYPTGRPDFDSFTGPYIGDPLNPNADISKIWNPEAFFNTFVVNGVTWPRLKVSDEPYRFRLLNGCNSRTVNLSMFVVTPGTDGVYGTADDVLGAEVPFYQIGGDQGFLPAVTMVQTGFMQALVPGDPLPTATPTPGDNQALLMMPAERADVIVNFAAVPGLTNGMHIRIINTAGDGPFNGSLAVAEAADPLTSGQVMEFVIDTSIPHGLASTPVNQLVLPPDTALGASSNTRQLSLNEMISDTTCIAVDPNLQDAFVTTVQVATDPLVPMTEAACATAVADYNTANGTAWGSAIAGPRQALLGTMTPDGLGGLIPATQRWMDPITQNPFLGSTETWEVYNTTADAHPIHVHLVRFEIVGRESIAVSDPLTGAVVLDPATPAHPLLPNEQGFKDTVVAYPGEVTRLKAKFDILGRYVWHCHIVEHEDNEMMLPFDVVFVGPPADPATLTVPAASSTGSYTVSWTASTTPLVTYLLQESTDPAFVNPAPTDIPTTGLSAQITGKGVGTYYYRVQAISNAGTPGNFVTAANGALVTLPAPAPGSVTVPVSSTTGSYTVSWTASSPPGATATYTLEESTTATFDPGTVTPVASGITGLSQVITPAKTGGTYFYRVSATAPGYSPSPATSAANGVAIIRTDITSPVAGAPFALGDTINLAATVTIPAGYVISGVDFYDNGTLIGSGTPGLTWTLAYTPTAIGNHNLMATTTYVNGATSSSPVIPVSVTGTLTGPTFTAPTAGSTFDLGTPITVTATPATVAGTSVTVVMFYESGNFIGAAAASPYTFVWNPTTGGAKSLTATAYYANGQFATSTPLALTVNDTVAAPASITVPATSTTGNYTVSWTASATVGATYTLEESTDPTFATTTQVWTGLTTLSQNITGKMTGTYYYRVKGVKLPLLDSNWTIDGTGCTMVFNVAAQANGGVATASSVYGTYVPAYANDGDRLGIGYLSGKGAWFDNTMNIYPDWLEVAFIGPQSVSEIDVFTVQDNYSAPVDPTLSMIFSLYGNTAFDVQYWDATASNWVTVPGGGIVGNNKVWTQLSFTPITTDRIRVQVNAALFRYSRIVEVEAYAPFVPAPTSVSLTSPVDLATFGPAPATINLAADVVPAPGWTTDKVEFYEGVNLLGTATAAPYTFSWTNVPAGSYSLTAVAYSGASTVTSSPVSVTVNSTALVNVAAQANGGVATASSVYGSYAPAYANDGDRLGIGYVSGKGAWFDNTMNIYPDWLEVTFTGPQSISEIDVFTVQDNYSAPVDPTLSMIFSLYGNTAFDVQYWDATNSTWVTVPGGSIVGNNKVWTQLSFAPITTDRIRVQVNAALFRYSRIVEVEAYAPYVPPPTSVSLTSPADLATFAPAPATINLAADVVPAPGWTTDKVEFYEGVNLLGTATAAPYTFSWTNVPAGSYSLTAVAYSGVSTVTSSPVSVTVNITAPVNVASQANGGVATASSVYGTYVPAYANDGDRLGTGYVSGKGAWIDNTMNIYPDWLEVAFTGPQTINEIDVFTLQDNYSAPVDPTLSMTFSLYGNTAFDVQYWDTTASNWVTVPGGSIVGNNKVWTKLSFTPITTDRIRVQVNAALFRYSRIVEVEAYAP